MSGSHEKPLNNRDCLHRALRMLVVTRQSNNSPIPIREYSFSEDEEKQSMVRSMLTESFVSRKTGFTIRSAIIIARAENQKR